MAENTVTLRLTANADGVVSGVRLASSEVSRLGGASQQAGEQAAAGFGRARAGVASISTQLQALRAQFIAFVGAAQVVNVLRGMVRMSDEVSNINSRLKLATRSQSELAVAQAATYAISQRTSTALESTAILYARLAQSTRDYGLSQKQQLALVETINQTFAISGASAEAQKNAVIQFTQSLAGGVLRAEEFNSVIENSPRLAQALADGMNMTMGGLRKAVNDGQVSVERMTEALESQAAVVASEYAQIPLTVERAWTQLRNAVTQGVGGALQEIGAGGALANGVAFIAEHMALLGKAIVAVAMVLGGRLVAAAIAYIGKQAVQIQQARAQMQAELAAARAAEAHAAARVALGRAGMLAGGQLAAAEAALAAAQLRTAAATQAASLALTAKAAAMRMLNGVMAAFGGPVGVAITALAMFVTWLVSSRDASKRLTEELNSGVRDSLKALEAFNKAPTFDATQALASVGKQVSDINKKLAELREKQQALKGLDKIPNPDAWLAYKLTIGDTNEQITAHEGALRALGPAYSKAVAGTAALLQEMIGVKDVSPNTRAELAILANAIVEGKDVSSYAAQALARLAAEEGNAGAAALLLKNGLDGAKQSLADISELTSAAAGRMANLRVQLAGIKGGTADAIGQRYLEEINARGGAAAIGNDGMTKIWRAMVDEIQLTKEVEAAQKAQAEARKDAAAAARDAAKANDQLKESQARYTAQAALAAAELRGPLALAQAQSKQKTDELDAALAKHSITRAAHTVLVDAEAAALAKRAAEISKQINAPQALLNAMTGELELLRKIGPERELERRRLQAESEMQRALADAREAAGDAAAREQAAVANGYATWQDYEAAMLAAADANAVASMKMEEAAKQAEDWARAWLDAVDGVADAFTGFVMSGLRDFKGLAKDLKNIAKQLVGDLVRTFLQQKIVIPIQTQIMQSFSGGAGQQGFGALLNNGFDRLLGGIGKLFGRGGAAQAAIEAGTSSGMGAWTGSLVEAGSMQARALAGLPAGKAAGIGASPWMGALGGAVMGWGMGGDTAGKVGGAVAGGVAGYGLMVGGGAAMAASAGGAGLMGAASAGLAAIPVVGWVALAALAVNAISGGKLFGTKYKMESGAQQFDISGAGATGFESVTEVRQRSFFRGRKWNTTTSALDAEAQASIEQLFDTLKKTVETASAELGVAVPNIVGGSFRREFDSKGNLTKEFGTIAGRVYNEAQEAFAARLVGENLLAVAKQAGSAAELEQLANAYRATGEQLQSFAALALAVQQDLKSSEGIWQQVSGEGVMTRIVKYIEGIAKAGESLADAYARVQQTVQQYGDLIGGVRQQIATRGLNQYQKAQLDIELAYRSQVKQANDLAKALGLSGARAEDLAAIEQLRALNMADLAKQYAEQQKAQNQQWLADLGLSDLSPLRDDQKLSKAMGMLQEAVDAGDSARAQKLAEQVLGLGRDMYASGADYSALYEQVTALIGEIGTKSMEELQGLTNSELANLADLVSGLPSKIAQELAQVLVGDSGTLVTPAPLPPPPAPSPVQPPEGGLIGTPGVGGKYPSADPMGVMVGEPSPYGGASNGGQVIKLLSSIAESTGALKRQGASAELAALNGWRVR